MAISYRDFLRFCFCYVIEIEWRFYLVVVMYCCEVLLGDVIVCVDGVCIAVMGGRKFRRVFCFGFVVELACDLLLSSCLFA